MELNWSIENWCYLGALNEFTSNLGQWTNQQKQELGKIFLIHPQEFGEWWPQQWINMINEHPNIKLLASLGACSQLFQTRQSSSLYKKLNSSWFSWSGTGTTIVPFTIIHRDQPIGLDSSQAGFHRLVSYKGDEQTEPYINILCAQNKRVFWQTYQFGDPPQQASCITCGLGWLSQSWWSCLPRGVSILKCKASEATI